MKSSNLESRDALDRVLADAVAEGQAPGVVGLVTDSLETRYESAAGARSLGQAQAMTSDTVVWLASMTKAITCAGVLQLLEQGRVDLDGPAGQWFPALRDAKVLAGFDPQGQPVLRDPLRPVTLRHLLTHTSGYGYEFFSADNLRFQKATGTPGVITCRNAVFDNPLLFEPGERWQYGMGIEPVGRIIECVTGQRLGDYLRDHLLQPLGMDDTAFRISPAMRERLAGVHKRDAQGALSTVPMEITQTPEFEMGGGGLYGTARDYARFIRLILNRGLHQGVRLLQESTIALMSNHALGDLRVRPLQSSIAPVSNDVDLYPGVSKTWSLAFMVNEAPLPTGRAAGGLMWAGLANTYFWIDPANDIGGVFLSQLLPFADPIVLSHFQAFETAAYQALGRSGVHPA